MTNIPVSRRWVPFLSARDLGRLLETLFRGVPDALQQIRVGLHEFMEITDPEREQLTACLGDHGGGARGMLDE